MPYMTNGKRDYKRENALYDSRPEIKKRRAERNRARQEALRQGLVHKGDNKQVDHIRPLSRGGSATDRSNRRIVPASQNESFSRNRDGSLKNQTSSRERRTR